MRFSVEPAAIRVLTSGGFYLTVVGSGVGRLRCYAEGKRSAAAARWVFGPFRETFLLSNLASTTTAVIVEGSGLGGGQRVVVPFDVAARMHGPSVFRRRVMLPALRRPRWQRVSPGDVSPRLMARWRQFLLEHT